MAAPPPSPIHIAIQKTSSLHVRRMDDRWFVWIAGSPHTQHHTYLALHDSGKVERITEGPDVYVVADMTGA